MDMFELSGDDQDGCATISGSGFYAKSLAHDSCRFQCTKITNTCMSLTHV